MADAVWLGGAAGRAQVDTLTVAGSFAAADTVTLTIGAAQLVLTLGTNSAASTSTVAAAIKAMLAGDAITLDETRSNVGTSVGQFAGLTATVSSAVVTVTGRSDGTPFTLTAADTAAGSVTQATATTATGPYHFTNAKNWLAGSVPVVTNTLNFDHRAVNGLKYAIDISYTPLYNSFYVAEGYNYEIGLPAINQQEAGLPYPEYRPRYLELYTQTITIKGGIGAMKIDTGSVGPIDYYIARASQGNLSTEPTVLIKGTNLDDFFVGGGDIGLAWDIGTTAQIDELRVSPEAGKEAKVFCGAGLTIVTGVKQNGGDVVTNTNPVLVDLSGGTYTHATGALTTLNQDGGTTVYLSAGTLTTARVSGGLIDFSRNLTGKTVTNFTITKGAGYRDPNGTVTHTNGIDLYGCSPSELSEFSIPKHRTITLSAI